MRPENSGLLAPVPCDFNPRIRVGCDHNQHSYLNIATQFQSTHPCRMRRHRADLQLLIREFQSTHPCRMRLPRHISECTNKFNFNPRIRVGCDFTGNPFCPYNILFQSTHPCRMRRINVEFSGWGHFISIHASV